MSTKYTKSQIYYDCVAMTARARSLMERLHVHCCSSRTLFCFSAKVIVIDHIIMVAIIYYYRSVLRLYVYPPARMHVWTGLY